MVVRAIPKWFGLRNTPHSILTVYERLEQLFIDLLRADSVTALKDNYLELHFDMGPDGKSDVKYLRGAKTG